MLDKILRALIILSAGVTVILRYLTFRMSAELSAETISLLNTVSLVSVVVLAVSGGLFAILLKRTQNDR